MVWIEIDDEQRRARRRRPWSGCRGPRSPRRAAPAPRRGRAEPRAAAPARPIPRPTHRRRRLPALASRAATWSSRVDLPMPGSPPTSIADPATIPPPIARSNSAMPARQPLGQRAPACRARPAGSARPPPCRLCLAAKMLDTSAGFLDQRVPFGAIGALPLPAVLTPTRRPGRHIGIWAWPSLAWSRHCGEARNGGAALGR